MSKGLDALDFIKKDHFVDGRLPLIDRARFEIIEKELKALEIIIKKAYIRVGKMGEQYYFKTTNNYYFISKEKYDLLKEVLL